MKAASSSSRTEPDLFPPLARWIVSGNAENAEEAAFRAGAALAHLRSIEAAPDLPLALLRDRLALMAAETCVAITGRREGQAALRDAVHLTRAGDNTGPAGMILQQWSRAVLRPMTVLHLAKALPGTSADQIALCLDVVGGTPVDRAARVIEAVLTDSPRAEVAALILGDAVLSQAVGLEHLLPLVSLAIKPRDLRLRGDDLRVACHRAVLAGVMRAVPLAGDLARRAVRLQTVAPKLRAKGAAKAVDLFLSRDALAPSTFGFMSDRAARRLCDRLVELEVVRELTGRDTFRLYGL